MFKKFISFLFLISTLSYGLLGCATNNNSSTANVSSSIKLTPSDLNTNVTDRTKLQRDFTGKSFINDGIGKVTLATVMDGDTAHFMEGHEKVKVRFIGVNTPESTAKMEPWGNPAKVYVRNLLNTEGIELVLENDIAVFGQKDNNGSRYLGFVWYKLPSNTDYRLLNLELVELAYSRNQLFIESTLCNYLSAFVEASNHAEACGAKVYGEIDPTFDYSNNLYNISLRTIREDYDTYGANDDSSGSQLRITALVVGMIGDNMVLRDVVEPYDDGTYAGLYAYLGYNSSLASVVKPGMIVEFTCRATKFNGAIQLSDVKSSFTSTKHRFEVIAATIEEAVELYADEDINIDPVVIDDTNQNAYTQFAPYTGYYVEVTVTIRNANRDEYDEDGQPVVVNSYFNKDSNNNITIYASFNSRIVMNLRVDGQMYPYVSETMFEVGATYRVRGYLNPYFDKYQVQLFNNVPTYNYITKIS